MITHIIVPHHTIRTSYIKYIIQSHIHQASKQTHCKHATILTTIMASSSSSSSLRRQNEEEELKLVKIIQNKLRTNHGMGGFSKSLMRNVVVRSYSSSSSSSSPSADSSLSSSSGIGQQLVVAFPVTKELCNNYDTLHGGAQATAIDIFTSILLLYQAAPVPSVTSDLHVSCVAPAPLGSTVVCVCNVERSGGGLQFASCDLYREEETEKRQDCGDVLTTTTTTRRVLVGKGLHTKYVLKHRSKGFVSDNGGRKNEKTITKSTNNNLRSKL